ncbi:MAG: UPF0280 family protein [Desulfobulbaceae bacterium]|nr:UPF0280 family protein [Desulfobulbaceae bacterium]
MKRVKAKKPESYIQRAYRAIPDHGRLISSFASIKDTDLHILADREVSDLAQQLALQYRLQIENYIQQHPEFAKALSPLSLDTLAPPIVKEMLAAGISAGVGPMAAVAGVIAEFVGRGLLQSGCREVLVENGGDIYINRCQGCTVAIFAGESSLSLRVGVKLAEHDMPIAVCTSSGTVGHSLSFGLADSVTVIARSTALADAAATCLGNEVGLSSGGDSGIKRSLEKSRTIEGILGVVVICGEKIGAVGDVELVSIG